MSITDLRGFIKSHGEVRKRDIVIVALIALSALGGFLVGVLSSQSGQISVVDGRAAVGVSLESKREGQEASLEVFLGVPEGAGSVVASKTGTRYHFPWCAGARSIKEENQLWFESTEKAREAGYVPASNCKGLK